MWGDRLFNKIPIVPTIRQLNSTSSSCAPAPMLLSPAAYRRGQSHLTPPQYAPPVIQSPGDNIARLIVTGVLAVGRVLSWRLNQVSRLGTRRYRCCCPGALTAIFAGTQQNSRHIFVNQFLQIDLLAAQGADTTSEHTPRSCGTSPPG